MMSDPAAAPADASEPTPWASSHGRRTASGIFLVFLGDALILPTGLVTAGFLTRRLGPEDYGLFTLATVLVVCGESLIVSIFSPATISSVGATKDWGPIGATVARVPRRGAAARSRLRRGRPTRGHHIPRATPGGLSRAGGGRDTPSLVLSGSHQCARGVGRVSDSRAGAGRPLGRAALADSNRARAAEGSRFGDFKLRAAKLNP
jgi:hypothetical protein